VFLSRKPKLTLSTESHKLLTQIISDPKRVNEFKKFLKPDGKKLLEFWLETERFLQLSSCADPIVVNNLTLNLCHSYHFCQSLPVSTQSKLTRHMQCQYDTVEKNTRFIQKCQAEAFELLRNEYFSSYWLSRNSSFSSFDYSQRSVAGLIVADPWDETSDDGKIRYIESQNGSIVVAASIEKLIVLVTANISGWFFFVFFF
jgi:hypothetical protein